MEWQQQTFRRIASSTGVVDIVDILLASAANPTREQTI